jgi:hypothetical protein
MLEEEGEEESPSKFIPTSVPRPSQCLYTTHAEIPPYLFLFYNERTKPAKATFLIPAGVCINSCLIDIHSAGVHTHTAFLSIYIYGRDAFAARACARSWFMWPALTAIELAIGLLLLVLCRDNSNDRGGRSIDRWSKCAIIFATCECKLALVEYELKRRSWHC